MTIYLKNTTKNQSLVLRYGESLQYKLQINPLQEKELPVSMSKSLLKHYLSTFKSLLKVIEKDNKEEINVPKADKVKTEISEEKVETKNETESSNNDNTDGTDTTSREDNKKELTEKYNEKQLNELSAKEIKKIAESLGIEVNESSTKKLLIPVILNKQGK